MTENPKVSVIMGIYNCESTLSAAIESILNQTYENWELILYDDGSTDNTYGIACAYAEQDSRIKVLHGEMNQKLSHALNQCLQNASGELIARMDGDDLSQPERLEKQLYYLLTHPEIQLVGTAMRRFDESGSYDVVHPVSEPDLLYLRKNVPFFHATVLTFRDVYQSLGGYSEEKWVEGVEDCDLWFRFFHAGFKGYNIDEPLYFVRENKQAIQRRTMKRRINTIRTISNGYRLVGFPKRWLIKPSCILLLKGMTPSFVIRAIRWFQAKQGASPT